VPNSTAYARAHTIKIATVADRWQRVGDLIGSGFKPHTSRTAEADSYHLHHLAVHHLT